MTTEQPGPTEYLEMGFKAIRLRGYNPKYNGSHDYKTAKESIDKKYTDADFAGMNHEAIGKWETAEGWTGWRVPAGDIVIDSENKTVLALVENYLKTAGINPSIQKTNNGKQYLFKCAPGPTYRDLQNTSVQAVTPLHRVSEGKTTSSSHPRMDDLGKCGRLLKNYRNSPPT